MLNNKTYLCIVDYYSKFSVVKQMEMPYADKLLKHVGLYFHKWTSERDNVWCWYKFCLSGILGISTRYLNIQQAVLSSYNHQSNGQAEVCIKFIKWTVKKCFDTNNDVYLALLQILSTPNGPLLGSPAALIFNKPIRGLMPKLSRHPYYKILVMIAMLS